MSGPASGWDVLVVGAGIVGAAAALRLAAGGRRVALLDPDPARAVGSATVASGAMLGVLGEVGRDGEPDLALRAQAGVAYEGWLDEVAASGAAVPKLHRGTFVVVSARRERDIHAAEAIERAAVQLGLPCERVAPGDVPGLQPAPGHRPERVLHLAMEGFIEAPALRAALVDAARLRGATLIDGTARALHTADDAVVGLELGDGSRHLAEDVVLCTGADVGVLLAASGLASDLMPVVVHAKGVGLTLRPGAYGSGLAPPSVLRTPNREFACGLHIVPREDGSLYLGATNRATRFAESVGATTAGEVALLLTQAPRELNSTLGAWNLTGAVHGRRPLPVDGMPVVGRTALDGLVIATGTYRNGVLLAPVLAQRLERSLDGDEDERLSPRRPRPTLAAGDVFRAGIADLSQMLSDAEEPAWSTRLEGVLGALFSLGIDGRDPRAEHLRRLLVEWPRPEMLPEVVIELLQAVVGHELESG